jgi:hypothetical protein
MPTYKLLKYKDLYKMEKTPEEIIEEMQAVAAQMVIDDLEENPDLATKFMHLGDRTVKTIVKNYGLIHYEETKENPAGGHVPKNSTFLGALLFNGENVQGCGTNKIPTDTKDEKIRLIHCRYKGYSEYLNKMKVCKTISDEKHKEKHWNFDFILDYLQ